MVKNNLTNFVKCGVRPTYALSFCRLWYYCFWQGFVREFGVELVGVCRECEKDDDFKLRRKSSAGRALVCFF